MLERRTLLGVALTTAASVVAPRRANAQPYGSAADQQTAQRALQTAWQILGQTAMIRGTTLYVEFRISGGPPSPPPSGGFAPPLQPQPASPFVRSGVMAINTFQPQAFTIQPGDGSGNGWRGQVQFRIYRYALYDFPQRNWGPWHLVTLHFWTWNAYQADGQLRLVPDPQTGGADTGPTEFIGSVFAITPAAVMCRPAQ
jgi:hypothetical protein